MILTDFLTNVLEKIKSIESFNRFETISKFFDNR